MAEQPTVAIVGQGAIGTTIAAAHHEVGRTPAIFGRIARESVELRFDGGNIEVPEPVQIDPAAIENTFGLVFAAVKSTQTKRPRHGCPPCAARRQSPEYLRTASSRSAPAAVNALALWR